MIVHHAYVPQTLARSKREVIISRQSPITLIFNNKLTFLNNIIKAVFNQAGLAFEQKLGDDHRLMGSTLPVICFEDVVLQQSAIVEFLADICLSSLPLKEYVQRKENLRRMYTVWHSILEDEVEDKVILKSQNILTKNDHTNRIFQELINISTNIVNKGYQRIFDNYDSNTFNLESVFVTYLTHTILEELPTKHTDFIMRSYFSKQIDFAEQYSRLLERAWGEEKIGKRAVLVDGKAPVEPAHPKKKLNLKWFVGVLLLSTSIFLKWSK